LRCCGGICKNWIDQQRKQEDSVGLPGESAELSDFTIAAQQSMSIAPGS
jgi:hypothetical protein